MPTFSACPKCSCKFFGHRDTIYIRIRPWVWKPFEWLSLKVQNSEKMGVRHRILLRRVGFCWDHTKTSWIEKNQHLLYKSILYCQLILQNSKIITIILSIWQRHIQNNQFCWFLKNQLIMENTFVKQMLIFFNLWCFGMISANSNSSQQYSVPYPHFFQNFGLSSWKKWG